MLRILGTIFAGLLGLAFGSFLNVCLSRWPTGESVVQPRSHCRNCEHTLAWWENIPVVSWLALRGRCRKCRVAIGLRYPLVELAVAGLWAFALWRSIPSLPDVNLSESMIFSALVMGLAQMIFLWVLVALAILDAENLWLPNALTFPGIVLGLAWTAAPEQFLPHLNGTRRPLHAILAAVIAAAVAALLILLIRWIYWLIRRREGIGIGDVKLMALLGAWLGLQGALLAFGIAAILGATVGVALLVMPTSRRESSTWGTSKLPLGTFLCVGGIVSSFWDQQIIAAYLRWSGL